VNEGERWRFVMNDSIPFCSLACYVLSRVNEKMLESVCIMIKVNRFLSISYRLNAYNLVIVPR
jgi:hypothetical protein